MYIYIIGTLYIHKNKMFYRYVSSICIEKCVCIHTHILQHEGNIYTLLVHVKMHTYKKKTDTNV